MKKVSTAVMIVILCLSMFWMLSTTIPTVKAATTQVFVDPSSQTVANIGDSFTVNVNITNVADLYGYALELDYDSTVMNGTIGTPTGGSFLKTGGSTAFLVVSFNDQYNAAYGALVITDFLTGNVPGVSGSGVLATVQFKATAPGDSVSLHLAYVTLTDSTDQSITPTTSDGTVTVAAVNSWPMFHREPAHTGYSTSTAPSTNQTLWNYTTGAPVISSPTVAGGILYVGSDKVYALNASTGVSIWNYTRGSYFQSSPAVAGGMVFVGSDDGNVTALNASSGAFIWNYTTLAPVFSSPAVVSGKVFVGSEDHRVYALNETTGAQIWNYTTNSQVFSSPAVTGGMVFVGSDDHNVTALDASTGLRIWNYTTSGPVFSSPTVVSGKVFVGSEDGRVYALNETTGAQIWNYTTGSSVRSSPAYDEEEGVIFVGSDDGNVTALLPSSGAFERNYTTGASVFSSPAVANGMVFVGSNDGNVTAFFDYSFATFAWSYATGSLGVVSSPAVAGGRVFVGSNDSKVYAFGLNVTILPSSVTMDLGQSQLFTSIIAGGVSPYTYQWYLNGTPVSNAISSWTFTPSSSGYYTVYANVTDNFGVSAISNIASVTVNSALLVSVSPANVTMDVGQSQLFTSSVSGDSGPSYHAYQWYLNGASVPGAMSSTWTFTPSLSGSYSVYLNVTDTATSFWAVSSPSASVIVNPAFSVRVFPANVTIYVGQSQLFASSVSGGMFPYSYRWYLNGVAVSGATSGNWTFTPSFAGNYTVMVKVNDAVGSTYTSDQSNVTVLVVDWWPMFHHDLTHTGYSTSTAPSTNQTLWTYTVGSAVYSSPAVFGGLVFVGSDKVYALNASTGVLVWSYTPGYHVQSSPAVFGGMVFVGSDKVYALNASTGVLVWSYTPGGQVFSSPTVVDGRVYVGAGDGNVYALDVGTGALVWKYTTGGPVVSSPAVAGGVVFVGSEDDDVYALNELSGARMWSYNFSALVDSSPAFAGGIVYVGSYDGNVYALNATTGARMSVSYSTGSDSPVFSSPAIAGGMVYVGSENGIIYAWNASRGGTPMWIYPTGSYVFSSPAVAGGVVFVGSYDNNVYALNASTGVLVWKYATGSWVVSSPAVSGGVVFVGSYDGNLYAFGIVPLSASISPGSVTMDVGQSQLFNSSVTGGISPYLYQWYLNGTLVYTGANWTFASSSSGSYSVYLIITDNVGLPTESNIVSMTVSGAPSVTISPTSVTVDVGQPQIFTATASGGTSSYTYQWYLNGALSFTSTTSSSWTFTPSSAGSYTVYVNVTDSVGLRVMSNIASVTVISALLVSVSPSSVTMDVGQSQVFSAQASGGSPPYVFYQWYQNGPVLNGPVSGATSSTWTFIPSLAGSYTVYVTVTDSVEALATSSSATATVTSAVVADWWPMFHHDLAHTGYSTSAALSTNQTLWTYPTGSAVYSSPAVFGGVVYVSSSNRVYALDASTGVSIWNYTTGGQVYSSPAVANGLVFVGSDRVYALAASTGALVWSYTPGGQIYCSPAVSGGMVYVGSLDGNVYALNAVSGVLVWSHATGGQVYSSPAVSAGTVYVGSYSDNVSAFDASHGTSLWNYTTGSAVYSSPAVANSIVYVGSLDGNVYALNNLTGAKIWNHATGGQVYSSPAVSAGTVYVGSYSDNVSAFDASHGTSLWNYTTGSAVDSSPAVAGGMVYVGSDKVYALIASSGNLVWSYTTGAEVGSSPAVFGGVSGSSPAVFVGSDGGKVYAFGQGLLSAPTVSASLGTVDQGQSSSLTSSTMTTGKPPYSYQWLQKAPGAGSYSSITGAISFSYSFATTTSTATGTWSFELNVTDSSSPPKTVASSAASVTVNSALSTPVVSPSSWTMDVGQSEQFSVSASGGTSPQSYQWYLGSSAVSGQTGTTYTFTASSVGSPTIYCKVTDSASSSVTVQSNTPSVTVNSALATPSGSASAGTVNQGQSSTLSVTGLSGGTTPYSYQWLQKAPGAGSYSSITGATLNTYTFSTSSSTATGTWSFELQVTDHTGTVVTSAAATIVVNAASGGAYALTMYTVGQGSVVPGNQTYPAGTNVGIQAIPAAGWLFAGWGGGASGLTNTTIVMNSDTMVTATFAQTQTSYALTMYTVGQGSVVPGNGTYAAGTNVGIQAIPAAGWLFAGWTGDETGSSNTTITVNGNMFVTATFTQGAFSLTMYTVGQGTVQPGNGTYPAGTSVNITAITVAGWSFQGWSGNAIGFSNTTIIMNGNMFVTATFSQVVAGHNVAVTNIASQKTSIGQGLSTNITVTIANLGTFDETFNVTVSANVTVIATFNNTALTSGNSITLGFTWNTKSFVMGDYIISAYAGPVPGDVNTTKLYLSTGPVAVTIIGDLNGDFKVSLADLVLMANAYRSRPGDANWNPNADILGQGVVNLADLVTLAQHYGQHYP